MSRPSSSPRLARLLVALQIVLMVATLFAPIPAAAVDDPLADPSPTPSAEPSPTPEATPEPTPEATPEATPEPTPDATPEATPEPSPTPAPEPATEPYIVTFASGVSSADADAVLAAVNAVETGSIPQLRMRTILLAPSAEADSVAALRDDSRIARVDADRQRVAETAPSDPSYEDQWALPQIGWDDARSNHSASGSAVVAVLDTGVDISHPDLDGAIVSGASILDGSTWWNDPNGHGTAMAGIVAAETDNGEGIAGVGFDGVKVMPITVLGADGTGQDSDVISGVVWAADHDADVILMAFSSGSYSASLQAAVDYAWSRGVVLVAAAGNDGSSAGAFPAGDRGVIGVSNTTPSDTLAASSNYGASVFLGAPGVGIYTTDNDGGYRYVSGTSASAAIVAGVAAELMAVDPSVSNGVVVGRLARNADPAGTVEETGNGRVNLDRALDDASTESVKPAGSAPLGGGGPFVGPYVAASNFADVTGTIRDSVTNLPISGATVTVTCPGCNGTGTTAYTGGGAATNATGIYTVSGWQYSGGGPATITVTASAPGYAANAGSTGSTTCNQNGNCTPTRTINLTLTPAATASISGTVWNDLNGNGSFDSGEPGISGVTVSRTGTSSGTTTTGVGGTYNFSGLAAGTYSVDYTVPTNFVNTGTKPISGIVLAAGGSATGKDFFAQQRNASISGTVWNDLNGNGSFDSGEPGLVGVSVSYSGGTPATSGTTTTIVGGAYTISGLQAGTYSVDYTVPTNFANTGTKPITGIVLGPGGSSANRNFFAQQRNASISGTVWNDLNGNGSLDGGEPGLVGVSVSYSGGTPATSGTTTTIAGGAYTISGLQAGTYSVDYTVPSGYINTGTQPLTGIVLGAGGSATGKDFFAQQRNASISGTVWNDLNGNGSFDSGEPGISGVTVSRTGTSSGTTTTGVGGTYNFSGLAAGTYSVDYTVPTNFVNTGTKPISGIVLAAGGSATGKDFFAQQRNASISGTVYNDLNGNGSLDGGEPGLVGVSVSYSGGTPATSGTTTTIVGGAYTISGLQAGTYSVDYTVPTNFANTGTKPITGIVLGPGGSSANRNFFAQQRNASISGTVWNDLNGNGSLDGGEPGLVGVSVSYSGGTPATSGTTTTIAGGAYTISGLQAGTYSVDYTVPSGYINTGTQPLTGIVLGAGGSATGKDFFAQAEAPNLMLEKSSGDTFYDSVGDILHYSFKLTNTGNVALAGPFSVTDDHAADEACPATASLAIGAFITCTGTYAVDQADLDAGSVQNFAFGTGSFNASPVVSNTDDLTINATQTPSLGIDKTSVDTSYDSVGDILHYSFALTNTGNVTLASPFTVLDDHATDEACPVTASLAPGAFITCTATYAVDQDDLDAGSVQNFAFGSASFNASPVVSNTDDLTINATQTAALNLDKTITAGDPYSAVGGTIAYQYVVTNTGNVTISSISVSDDNVDATPVCDVTTLAPTEAATCTAAYTITQADLDAGSVTNNASATGTPAGGTLVDPTDSATATATQTAALNLDKTITAGDPYSAVGGTIAYQYVVTNTGNVTISSISVSDDNVDATPVCDVTTLAPTEAATCTAAYTITQADLDAGSVTNNASATGTPAGGTLVDPTDSATATAIQVVTITIDKTGSLDDGPDDVATPGDLVGYTFDLTNTGNVTLHGVVVTDPSVTVSCPVGSDELAPGGTAQCSATYALVQADIDAGQVDNTADVDGLGPQDQPANDDDSETVLVPQVVTITIDKTGSLDDGPDDVATPGDLVGYTFDLTNTGNVTLHGVVVTDPSVTVSCPVGSDELAPGGTAQCSATYALVQADIDAGQVDNTADVDGLGPQDQPANDDDSETVLVPQVVTITIDKTGSLDDGPDDVATPGDLVGYTFDLTNTGNVTLHGVVVTDPSVTVSCPVGSDELAPGGTAQCSATYALVQADIDAGQVDNTADVDGLGPQDQPANDDDSETVLVPQVVTITIDKTGSLDDGPDDVATPGDLVGYTFDLTNTGNVTLHGVVVTDPSVTVSCPVGSDELAPGGTAQCSATYALVQADIDAGQVDNTADVDGLGPQDQPANDDDSETVLVPQVVTITIDKTGSLDDGPDDVATPGDLVGYTFDLTNTGNVTLHGVVVTDPSVTVSCPVGSDELAPGGTAQCSATYALVQADIDAGQVDNTADVDGLGPQDQPANDDDSETVLVPQVVTITIDKTGSLDDGPDDVATPGDLVGYTFDLTNTGNVTLHGVVVTDPSVTVSCPVGSDELAPGGTAQCSATYALVQADIDAGQVDNTADVDGLGPQDQPANDDDSETVLVPQVVTITIDKTGSLDDGPDDVATPGDLVGYTFDLTNTGNVTLHGVVVTDPSVTVSCPVGSDELAPGGTAQCSATYALVQADIDAGQVDNTADVDGLGPQDQPANDDDSETVLVPQVVTITIDKTGSLDDTVVSPSGRADPGDQIHYSFTVTNTGNVTLHDVLVTDPLTSLSCSIGTLAPAAVDSTTCAATYTLVQSDIDNGNRANTATVDGLGPQDQDATDSDTANVTLPAVATITIDKAGTLDITSSAPAARANPGDLISYAFVVTNTGNVTLHNVVVNDASVTITCPSAIDPLSPGETQTCTATHALTQADIDTGHVDNTASVNAESPTGDDLDPLDDITATDTETVSVPQIKSMSLDKQSGDGPFDHVGQVLHYTYILTNTGNVTLGGPFDITDDKATDAACTDSTMAPGASITCTGTYAVTQSDLDSGSVTNTATGTGMFGTETIASNSDSVTILADQKPAISLIKTSAQPSYNAAGQSLDYTYKLKNIGNVTLSGPITVADNNVAIQPDYDSGDADNDDRLDVGETWIFLATHDVTQDDVDNGSVTNKATGHAVFGVTTYDTTEQTLTVNAVQNPSLDLAKTITESTYTFEGQVLHYSYKLVNAGNVTLENANVTDDNATTPGYASGDSDGDNKLDVGETWMFTATHVVSLAEIYAGSITNNAVGHATFHAAPVTSNTATKTIGATAADLMITKTSSAPWVYVDNPMTYTVTIKNVGPSTATNVVVNDPLPAGTAFDSATSTQGTCDSTVTCTIGSVAKNATVTITITVHQTQAGFFTNKATVTASENDQAPSNNEATVMTEARLRTTSLTYNGATTGDYHDPATASATLVDTTNGLPVYNKLVTFTLNGAESCSGTTNTSGFASCTIVPNEPAGTYTIVADFAGDTKYQASSNSKPFVVTREQTATTYTGASGPILNGSTVTLSGVLKEDGVTPISGRTLTLKLGTTQSCTATTNASGSASCSITVSQPLGAGTASATFAGDAYYLPSSDSKATLIYAAAPGGTGAFVIADQNTAGTVNFWGSQWSSTNQPSLGAAPSAFKGYAKFPASPTCGATFTTDPGNSAPPPNGPLPAYLSVIVTSKATKSGSTISGTIVHIVIVKTNPGYDANPGHPGTGTVVGTVC